MYKEKEYKQRFRYEEYVQYIQRLYNSGRLIGQDDFHTLSKLARDRDKIEKKAAYLGKHAILEQYLGAEIEDFLVLTSSYTKLLKVMVNTSDYLKKQLGQDVEEEDVIFETDEEALKAIDGVFTDIVYIKKEHADYLEPEDDTEVIAPVVTEKFQILLKCIDELEYLADSLKLTEDDRLIVTSVTDNLNALII